MSQLRSSNLMRRVMLMMILLLCLAGSAYSPANRACASNPNSLALPCCVHSSGDGNPWPCYECNPPVEGAQGR